MSLSMRLSKTKHGKQVIARAIACGMLLLVVPSCGIPHLRQSVPGPLEPGSYPPGFNDANSLENSAQVPIEDFFTDPKLNSLICQALVGNFELKIMYEDVQMAQNEILGRSGEYLPFVSLGLAAGLEKFSRFSPLGAAEEDLYYLPGKKFPGLPGNFLAVFDVSWEIDIWRRLRNLRDSAKLRFFATNEGRNYAITRLVADIAESYYGLMALDKRIENLNQIIEIQQTSLVGAQRLWQGGRVSTLPVRRFEAEIRSNQSQLLIAQQAIIELENHINFLVGRYPQPVDRNMGEFINLNLHALSLGVPAQLLLNRPDIRQAERELAANGLDVKAARARFFPQLAIAGPTGPTGPYAPVGWQAFNPKYLFWTPDALLVNVAGDLITPVINKRAIRADYKTANARQLQSIYNYQKVILNAYTEVVTRVNKVRNYSRSIDIKKEQVANLVTAVDIASQIFLNPVIAPAEGRRVTYLDLLFAQRDLWEARLLMIETKQQQLSAIVNVYQALGGGLLGCGCVDPNRPQPSPSEELPAPRELPKQPSASGKQPEQSPSPNLAPQDRLPEPRELPKDLPPSGTTPGDT